MFKTLINGKLTKVVFSHQKTSDSAPLTRPGFNGLDWDPKRTPIFAVTWCYFNDKPMGVSYCSLSDASRYSKDVGRRVALRRALQKVLPRQGRLDRPAISARRRVWIDYNQALEGHPTPRTVQTAAVFLNSTGIWVDETPMPTDADIPWKLAGQSLAMPDEVIASLNAEEVNDNN